MKEYKDKEKDKNWYDNKYHKSIEGKTSYYVQPEESIYAQIWNRIIDFISPEEKVADFGCGVGQFASMARKRNVEYVLGVDFSEVAIERAKTMNPDISGVFQCLNLFNPSIYLKEYDVAVFCEVLEHIIEDKKIISFVPPGKRIIFSLPTFGAHSHVRKFRDEQEVKERYENLIAIKNIEMIKLSRKISFIIVNSIKSKNI